MATKTIETVAGMTAASSVARWVVAQGIEVCDDGNQDPTDACLNDCTLARCGDGFVRAGVEACDDANQVQTDGVPQ